MRRISIWVGGVLLVALAVGVAAFALFEWDWARSTLVAKVKEATGRDFAIDGRLDGDLSLTPTIHAEGIRLAGAEWGSGPDLARIGDLTFRIELLELLRGRIVLPEVSIRDAAFHLEKNADGQANWDLATASPGGAVVEATVPEDRQEFPITGSLELDDVEVTYIDLGRDLEISSRVTQALGEAGEQPRLRLEGEGRFEGKPFELTFEGGSLLVLREENEAYPVDLEMTVGATSIATEGSLINPLNPSDMDLQLQVAGNNLADVFPILGVPLPPSPPYSLAGRLRRDGSVWHFEAFEGRVGDSDLSGDLAVDTAPERPKMTATLVSQKLDFDDLAGLIGAPPQTGEGETANAEQKALAKETASGARLLPDMPIELERLRAMDMQIDFAGKDVQAPKLPIESLQMEVNVDNGRLKLDPLSFDVADGSIAGTLILDGRDEVPRVESDLLLRNLSLKQFMKPTDMADLTEGRLGGRVQLGGYGRSLANVLATSGGKISLAMVGGRLSPLLVELIGLDIAESLAVVVADPQQPVTVRCAIGNFAVQKGIMRTQNLLMDTSDANIRGRGSIDLGKEELDMVFTADPKDASLLSANAPIAVSGRFTDPEVAIDPTDTSDKGGVEEAIGEIVNPIIALFPLIDLGLAEDSDCAGLLEKHNKQ